MLTLKHIINALCPFWNKGQSVWLCQSIGCVPFKDGSSYLDFGARHYDPEVAIQLAPDPLVGQRIARPGLHYLGFLLGGACWSTAESAE